MVGEWKLSLALTVRDDLYKSGCLAVKLPENIIPENKVDIFIKEPETLSFSGVYKQYLQGKTLTDYISKLLSGF
jgi:hypothetical protein